jgi:hypothetical protein
LIIIGFSINLYSQGGSNYSIFGIGDLQNGLGAAFDGLGGTSIAVPFSHSISTRNPAQWSFISSTRIQAGYRFSQQLVTNSTNTLYQNNGKVDGFLINFAIDTTIGSAINIGFGPYSSVNYLITSPVSITDDLGTVTGKMNYQGQGGLAQAYIGTSIRPIKNLSIGASIISLFGSSTKSNSTFLDLANSTSTKTESIDTYNGMAFRLGLMYEPISNLFVGAYSEIHSNLDITQNYLFYSSYLPDSTYHIDVMKQLPNQYGFGFSYTTGKFMFAGDYMLQDFSNLNYNISPNVKFRKYTAASFGISRLGNTNASAPLSDRTTYNFGITYKQNYLIVNNIEINELSGSFGFSLPIVGNAFLDAAFTFGVRGATTNGLVNEKFGRMTVSISLGDYWFQPFKRDF